MVSVVIRICFGVFLINSVGGSNTSCQDVDHAACISMSRQNPQMCQDAVLGRSVCPMLCNNCPLTCYSCHTASYDVSMCNQITCNPHQICMVQSTNETGPFTLGCGTDTHCNSLDDHAIKRGSTACCDTDLCNIPKSTFVIHVSQRPYPECPRDIIVFLDQSEPLVHNWTDAKTFLTDLISTMDIGPNRTQTRVAINSYDGLTVSAASWFSDLRHNKTDLLLQIQKLLPVYPRDNNGSMDLVVNVLLKDFQSIPNERSGNQPAVLDVPMFLTGRSGMRNDVVLADLRQRYSNIITIGIGNIKDKDSVRNVATDSNHAIFLNTTAELISTDTERRVLNLICGT